MHTTLQQQSLDPKSSRALTLLIRTDGSEEIGTGHIMRCLALAQAWQQTGGEAVFALAKCPPPLITRLEQDGMRVVWLRITLGEQDDAHETSTLARALEVSWLVLDGYHFGEEYQRTVKLSGVRLLLLDDFGHALRYYAEVILNQNMSATEQLYSLREPNTRLLLGPSFALLRREFWPWRSWQREISPSANKLLVTLGGSDPNNVTGTAVQAIELLNRSNIKARVVVGAASAHAKTLRELVNRNSVEITLLNNVTDMTTSMAWADVAISAAGSTCWELAFFGLPSITIVLAENQVPIAESLNEAGIVCSVGNHADVSVNKLAGRLEHLMHDHEARSQMSVRGRSVVDGYGAHRVITCLRAFLDADFSQRLL